MRATEVVLPSVGEPESLLVRTRELPPPAVGQALGPGVPADGVRVGQRVAALTKTGGWADHVVLPAADLVGVPDGVDPVDAETVVVNGVTAWRMLHRSARVRSGQTIVVL